MGVLITCGQNVGKMPPFHMWNCSLWANSQSANILSTCPGHVQPTTTSTPGRTAFSTTISGPFLANKRPSFPAHFAKIKRLYSHNETATRAEKKDARTYVCLSSGLRIPGSGFRAPDSGQALPFTACFLPTLAAAVACARRWTRCAPIRRLLY